MRNVIPLAGAAGLHRFARRTTVVRAAGAAALLALGLAAIVLLRDPKVEERGFLPGGSDGVVVLDLSASISTDTYERIGATLTDLVRTRGRYGLVVFSDTAYEALPPGTPADALRPLVRFFTLPKQERPGFLPQFPVNPWAASFSAGTRISAGLELARSVAIDYRLERPAVLLISDLDNDPADISRLNAIVEAYRREGFSLHVVGLNAAPEDVRLFRPITEENGSFAQARLPTERARGSVVTGFPSAFAVLAVALALLLAANEVAGARLTWRARREGAAA